MKSALVTTLLALACVLPSAQADPRPPELNAFGIYLKDGFVIAEIICGGTYGQTYRGGRSATLEVREGGNTSPFRVIWRGVLPDIGKEGYYITRPFASPVKVTTTFRLSISPGGDSNPGNDVKVQTFYPSRLSVDRPSVSPFRPKVRVQDKIKLFP